MSICGSKPEEITSISFILNLEIFKQSFMAQREIFECFILSYLSCSQAAINFPSIVIQADVSCPSEFKPKTLVS